MSSFVSRIIRAQTTGGSLLGDVSTCLYDVNEGGPATLPADALVSRCYISALSTLSGSADLSIGTCEDTTYFVGQKGLSTDWLNENKYVLNMEGLCAAPCEDTNITVTPSANVGGNLEVYIEYLIYDELP